MRLDQVVRGIAVLALVAAPNLSGQAASVRVLLGGGTGTDLRGVRSGAYAVAPSVLLNPNPNLAFNLGVRATRFTNREWSVGGSAAGIGRVPLGGGLALLLSGNGDGVQTSYRARYLQVEGIPALEWRSPALALWAGARIAAARTTFETGEAGLVQRSVEEHSAWGPAFGGSVRLARFGSGGGVELGYREEHGRPAGIRVIDRAGRLAVAHGPIVVSGSLGFRRAPDENRSFGGGQVVLNLSQGIAVVGAAESYPSNRLTGALGGRSLTAGLLVSFPGPRTPRSFPKPASIPEPEPGLTRLAFEAPRAARVEVAGDWNNWRPVPLTRSANGVWYVDLAIPPGEYRYAFRIDRKSWRVPPGVAAVDDGFGGRSAWLTVRGPERPAPQSGIPKEVP